ncbi:hypothetical protein BBJ28_00015906 [Nothophytophthora sp. Chile5]|nr:hypothetical protein BBJ28_00015906 [Nothophytophthora sp. Chile5]
MSCCPPEMEPPMATQGGEKGRVITYGQTELFVTGPPKAKAGIIALPDVFGVDSGRTKHDAEVLGKLGYAVVVVDLTHGDNMNAGSIPEWLVRFLSWVGIAGLIVGRWLKKYSYENFTGAGMRDALAYLQSEAGAEAVSSYGYCWGAWIGAVQCGQDTPVLKGHVSFHPSWKAENTVHGEGAVEKLAERITVPQLLLASGNDDEFVREGGSVEKILKAKSEIGELCRVVDFPDMIHGWVNRGDLNDPATKAGVDKAWGEAIKFMQAVNPPQSIN